MLKFDDLAKANGTVTFGGIEYALAQDAFISNVGTDGECAYFASAITRETEAEAIEINEASHRVQWDIQNPNCDDESDACDWAEPTDVKSLWGAQCQHNNPTARETPKMTTNNTMLMNPATGTVDTRENWLSEMSLWSDDPAECQRQFDSLVEVVENESGDWVEV